MTDKTIDHRLAWLAGIIDGEGWVGFGFRNHSASYRRRHRQYRWRGTVARFFLEVGNTNEQMIAEIVAISSILGVRSLVPKLRYATSAVRKPMWQLVFRDRKNLEPLLSAVLPFLIAKKAHAELMLRAMARRGGMRRGQPGYLKAGDDPVFRSMVDEAHALNRRGAPQEG